MCSCSIKGSEHRHPMFSRSVAVTYVWALSLPCTLQDKSAHPSTFWSSGPCLKQPEHILPAFPKLLSQKSTVSSGPAAPIMCHPLHCTAARLSSHMVLCSVDVVLIISVVPVGPRHQNLTHGSLFVFSLGSSPTTLFISKCPFLGETSLEFLRLNQAPVTFCHGKVHPFFSVRAKVIITHLLMWASIRLQLREDRYLMVPAVSTVLPASWDSLVFVYLFVWFFSCEGSRRKKEENTDSGWDGVAQMSLVGKGLDTERVKTWQRSKRRFRV